MIINTYLRYIIKELLAIFFFMFGGLYWIKRSFKRRQKLLILNYHNFSRYNNYKVRRGNIIETSYAENFEKQIHFLSRHFNFCYPEDFFSGKCQSGLNLLITFDDGYKDNFDIAFPILGNHNATAIFFLTTSLIGTNDWLWHDKVRFLGMQKSINSREAEEQLKRINEGGPIDPILRQIVTEEFPVLSPKRMMMDWEEARTIHKEGFKLGSHTANHVLLHLLTKEEQAKELLLSKSTLESKINNECKYLAFPNGQFNNDTLLLMKEREFEFGFTISHGVNNLNTRKDKLHRIGINTSDSIMVLIFKIWLSI